MSAVRNVALSGRTVMATIHQPSIEIFEAFDTLLLLQVRAAGSAVTCSCDSLGRVTYGNVLLCPCSTVLAAPCSQHVCAPSGAPLPYLTYTMWPLLPGPCSVGAVPRTLAPWVWRAAYWWPTCRPSLVRHLLLWTSHTTGIEALNIIEILRFSYPSGLACRHVTPPSAASISKAFSDNLTVRRPCKNL